MPFAAPEGTELVEAIGAGTMFDVAVVLHAGSRLICKRLTPRARASPEARAAIVREARALDLARHPALPALVRVGNDGHGPFLLETRIHGGSVRAIVEARRERGREVPRHLVRHVAREASAALAELHGLLDDAGPLGLVHGDLGPDHVWMDTLGHARFVDLGAARFRGMEASLATSDRGTLPFVAPEVARGEAPPSATTDVYALAATLLFLATGRRLCEASTESAMLVEVGDRGLRAQLVDDAGAFSPSQRRSLARALAFDPRARLRDASELARALDDER